MKKTILAVGAHPDDMEFGASGTLAKLVKEGWDAYLVICTDGSRGSDDPKMTHKKLSAIRKKEQLEAAKIVGIKKVFFLKHPDTQLVADLKLKRELVEIIRKVKPDVVISMDPTYYFSQERGYINHTDHRNAGQATLDAVFPLSRDRLTFLEHEEQGIKPHKTCEVWIATFGQADYIVNISDTIDTKIRALSLHVSQFADFSEVEKMVKGWATMMGKQKGYKAAEGFKKIVLR
jgi:LmbE family N-acetylglucosaminyl deacetylase